MVSNCSVFTILVPNEVEQFLCFDGLLIFWNSLHLFSFLLYKEGCLLLY